MDKMGLVFGCIDFIVTPDKEYIFLEVNEQGQFLWIEECNSDFKMLDIFVGSLVNKSKQYSWHNKQLKNSFKSYERQVVDIINQNLEQHICDFG